MTKIPSVSLKAYSVDQKKINYGKLAIIIILYFSAFFSGMEMLLFHPSNRVLN